MLGTEEGDSFRRDRIKLIMIGRRLCEKRINQIKMAGINKCY